MRHANWWLYSWLSKARILSAQNGKSPMSREVRLRATALKTGNRGSDPMPLMTTRALTHTQ